MPKFNFDHIFTGTMEEQSRKAGAFVEGLQLLARARLKLYADTILRGVMPSFALIEEIHEAQDALGIDPRTVVLAEWVNSQKTAKFKARVNAVIDEALR